MRNQSLFNKGTRCLLAHRLDHDSESTEAVNIVITSKV